MNRLLLWIAAAASAAGLLAGCGKAASAQRVNVSGAETSKEESEAEIFIHSDKESLEPEEDSLYDGFLSGERVEEGGMIRSFLTGKLVPAAQGNRRPLAVMMSNDKEARPQYGINRAGVVYEAPVEGGMNRFMSLIEDYDGLNRIGSVRSCRTYYIYFAKEFDGIYVHFGQSTFAKPYLSGIDDINGLDGVGGGAFYRTKDRKAPHNAYTGASLIQSAIRKLGYTQGYDPSYKGHYRFAEDGKEVSLEHLPGAMEAVTARPGYPVNQAYFLYEPSDRLYHRYQYGSVQLGDEGPVTAKNVIFQYCQSGYYATTQYLDINVHTSDCGYFMTDGKAIPIRWEKDGEFGPTHYYDLNHREIVLNQGQTWVCIISTKDFSKSEIIGNEGA